MNVIIIIAFAQSGRSRIMLAVSGRDRLRWIRGPSAAYHTKVDIMPTLKRFAAVCLIAFTAGCAVQSAPVPIDEPSRYELEFIGGDAQMSLNDEYFEGDLMLFSDNQYEAFRSLSVGLDSENGRASMTQLKIDSEGPTDRDTVICTGTMQSWGQPFYDTDQRAQFQSLSLYGVGPDVVALDFDAVSSNGNATGTAYFEIVGYR
jgi:uncharacterized protein (DUF779 family)